VSGQAPVRGRAARRRFVRATVDEIHDRLQVTDRVWHHIDYTRPLVVELTDCLLATRQAPARLLVIGGDSLLAYVLLKLGYHVDLWNFPEGHLTDDLLDRVEKTISTEQLAAGDFSIDGRSYDAILVPLVLESLPGDAPAFLSRLRYGLVPDGSLILATANASRLDLRLLALLGRSMAHAYPKSHVSFSFPPLPRLRYYNAQELRAVTRTAGLWTRESRFILSHRAFSKIDPHPPGRFLKLNLDHWLTWLLPETRPTILTQLSHRVGDEKPGGSENAPARRITVTLSAQRGKSDLQRSLTALMEQDYSPDLYEVIILHDGAATERGDWIEEITKGSPVSVRELVADPPEGPAARNAAMQMATGEVCAHTDDACRIPLGWLPTIASVFDDTTAVATGPVLDEPGSHPPFLTLPGSRPGWDHQGLFPIANVAYRREAILACGGFIEPKKAGRRATLLWDSELAWRIQRMGWEGRYLKHMFVFRDYPPPRHFGWFRTEWQLARDLPGVLTRVPELRKNLLKLGYFASNTTLYFDLLLVGSIAAIALQRWAFLLLGLPWVLHYSQFFDVWPVSQWRPSFRLIAGAAARHLIWLSGFVWGSLRAKRIVL